MTWNPFTKTDPKDEARSLVEKEKIESMLETMPGAKDMNMFQRFMAKRILSMSPEKRNEVLQKAMTPKNIAKHKDEILTQLSAMKQSGQMSDDQFRLAKRKLGF